MNNNLLGIKKIIDGEILKKYCFLKNYKIEPMNYEQDMDYIWDNCFGYYEPFSVIKGKPLIKINYFNEKLNEKELIITILHELYHAIQEFLNLPISERQSENFAQRKYKQIITQKHNKKRRK